MADYRQVAAEWVAQSPGGEGLDPEAIYALYEHCQYLDMVRPAGEPEPKEFLRQAWRAQALKFKEHGRGVDAAWMVAIEGLAAQMR